jgi:hypothetical protein
MIHPQMSDDRSVYLAATTGLMLGAIVITISIAAQLQWFWTVSPN